MIIVRINTIPATYPVQFDRQYIMTAIPDLGQIIYWKYSSADNNTTTFAGKVISVVALYDIYYSIHVSNVSVVN